MIPVYPAYEIARYERARQMREAATTPEQKAEAEKEMDAAHFKTLEQARAFWDAPVQQDRKAELHAGQ